MSARSRKEGSHDHVRSPCRVRFWSHPWTLCPSWKSNPELKLTLDYGHFICLGYAQEQVDPLVPYTAHFHLRQAAPKKLQARWDEGTLDFTGIVGKLASANYTGFLSLEYEHMEGVDGPGPGRRLHRNREDAESIAVPRLTAGGRRAFEAQLARSLRRRN